MPREAPITTHVEGAGAVVDSISARCPESSAGICRNGPKSRWTEGGGGKKLRSDVVDKDGGGGNINVSGARTTGQGGGRLETLCDFTCHLVRREEAQRKLSG